MLLASSNAPRISVAKQSAAGTGGEWERDEKERNEEGGEMKRRKKESEQKKEAKKESKEERKEERNERTNDWSSVN